MSAARLARRAVRGVAPSRRAAVASAVLFIAAACGGGDDAPASNEAAAAAGATATPPAAGAAATPPAVTPTAAPDLGIPDVALPPLDIEMHTVPTEEVYFDTFDGRSRRLTEADEALIARLRDAIPPIYAPLYERAEGGDWLGDRDLVIGYVGEGGQAYAYPHRILNFHEIVNDEIDGRPVRISYCPLCRSGVVYDRRLESRTLTFGNTSALFESDLVMFDWETNSYWWQVPGRAIVGTLAGQSLQPLRSETMRWSAWRDLHPQTLILSRDLGYPRDYSRDPFASFSDFLDGGGEPFPISEASRDDRLRPSDEVLGVVVAEQNRVYPLMRLGTTAVNDTIGGRPVVIFVDVERSTGTAFFAAADGRTLTFEYRDGGYFDVETGSRWDLAGRALGGPLAGARLEAPATRTTFWFAYIGAFPDSELYTPPG